MALYLRKKLDNKAEIAVWQITESEEELLGLTSVPKDELEEIQLFRNESHRKQKLAVRALLNEMFEEKMYLNHHDNGSSGGFPCCPGSPGFPRGLPFLSRMSER